MCKVFKIADRRSYQVECAHASIVAESEEGRHVTVEIYLTFTIMMISLFVCRKLKLFEHFAYTNECELSYMAKTAPDHDRLYRTAEEQAGYFTTAQSEQLGFSRPLLTYHARVGNFTRVAHGIYRLVHFPSSPFEDLFIALLRTGPSSVISHESALAVYNLSDVLPGEIHITVPRTASRRRRRIRLHTNKLDPEDIILREGLRITTVPRTIADVATTGLAKEFVHQAIREALQQGLTDRVNLLEMASRRGGRAARLITDGLAEEN